MIEMWRHGGYDGPSPWAMMLVGTFFLLVAAAAVVVLVWLVSRRRGVGGGLGGVNHGLGHWAGTPSSGAANPRALAILEERLARGEVDVDSYRAIRAELAPPSSPPAPPAPPAS